MVVILPTSHIDKSKNLSDNRRVMELQVKIHSQYAVTSAAGCTVTADDGATLCTAEAGKQGFFVAPCLTVTVSDDSAKVTEVFNSAPGALSGAGGGASGDPFANVEGDYLLLGNNKDKAEGRLDTITNAEGMFQGSSFLKAWNIPMPKLTKARSMFSQCSILSEFSSTLQMLEVGASMFLYCPKLGEFAVDMPKLDDAAEMFKNCQKLTNFASDLPFLTNANSMFANCYILENVNVSLPSLKYGQYMFENCRGLLAFSAALPALSNGNNMFYSGRLTSFHSDLPALTSASGMFQRCKLNLSSVQNIADTIATWTSGSHNITIGMAAELNGNADAAAALAAIRAKGWTVEEQYNS